MTAGISLSVLDLVPVSAGEGIEDAFAKSIELALLAERLGFHRFWIGEHHCVDGLGSSRPAILMAAVAARTDRLRIGAGGILLANQSALAAAEEINTLLALFPGRIDIALGRGTGFHDSVRHALAGSGWEPEPEAFATRFADLRSLLAGDMRMPELAGALTVTPPPPPPPATLWMLASSPAGAARAGSLGMPLAFAHHLNGAQTPAALDRYRAEFSSAATARPHVALSVTVVIGDDEQHATWLAGPYLAAFGRFDLDGVLPKIPPPDTAATWLKDRNLAEIVRQRRHGCVFGGVATVAERLHDLARRNAADELIISTIVHDRDDRRRSFERLADAMA